MTEATEAPVRLTSGPRRWWNWRGPAHDGRRRTRSSVLAGGCVEWESPVDSATTDDTEAVDADGSRTMSVTEVADVPKVTDRSVRRMCEEGRLSAEKSGKTWSIDADSLRRVRLGPSRHHLGRPVLGSGDHRARPPRRGGHRSGPALETVIEELVPDAFHNTDQYANNRIECDHGRLKARLCPVRGLKTDCTAGVVIAGHAFMQNLRRGFYELGVEAEPRLRIASASDELTEAI